VNPEKFENLVDEALQDLPEDFKKRLQNITVMVEDEPSREVCKRMGIPPNHILFGLYHGVPYPHRGPFYGNIPPDVIVIYQKPIERYNRTEQDMKKKVREVVIHEIGHYFGFDDAALSEIEKDRQE